LLLHAGKITTAVVTAWVAGTVTDAPVVLNAPSLFKLLPHPLLVLTVPSVALQDRQSSPPSPWPEDSCGEVTAGWSCC
jgi:hypothetical protein